MWSIEKSFNGVFVGNIQKIEFESGVSFVEKYIIETNVHYSEMYSSWFGEVDVYIPIREIQRRHKNLFKNEYFYVNFAGKKHKASANLYDTDSKCFDNTSYAYWRFEYTFDNFGEAKNTIEDLKNQFIRKLNKLYMKDAEKMLVQPVKRVIDYYPVYGYASLIEAKNKNLVVKRYLLPAEEKNGHYFIVRSFDLGKHSLANVIATVNDLWKLSDGNVYAIAEVVDEIERDANVQILQKIYSEQISQDLELINEKYNIAKQKIFQEYETSDYFDIVVNGENVCSIYTDRSFVYSTSHDNWYIKAIMNIPETVVKESRINEDVLFNVLDLYADASTGINKDTVIINGTKAVQLYIDVYGDKDPNRVKDSYKKVTQKIVQFIENQLQQENEK